MDLTTIGGLVARHSLTWLAGMLMMHGYLASGGTNEFVGAGMVFVGVAWSWWQKRGQAFVTARFAELRSHVRSIPAVSVATTPAQASAVNAAVSAAKEV
jgi:hypothetical protein